MEDHLLIKNCQDKERNAQRHLFDKYYKYVYIIAFRYLQNHHDCQDVTSEIFNRVFKSINQVVNSKENGLKRWIQTIAINESLRFLQKKRPVIYTDNDDILDQVEIDEYIDDSISIAKVRYVINEMPEGYRRIFLLHVVEGLTHAEIAEYLAISRNTSKSQMLKARKYLQGKLKEYESQKI